MAASLSRLRRDLRIFWRKQTAVSTKTISTSDIGKLRFYQFQPSTAEFFLNRAGTTKIATLDTPHFAFAKDLLDGRKQSAGAAYYTDYIRASWGNKATPEAVETRLAQFEGHLSAFTSGKSQLAIRLTKLGEGGPLYTVDGNHRTAFAAATGRELKYEMWPFDLLYLKTAPVGEFYGAGSSGVPYQPVFFAGKDIVHGRRNDLRQRLEMIPPEVLQGATLLDVASNIGTNAMLAVTMGAKACLGLEISENMAMQSTRLSVFNDLYPAVKFRQFNIDNDALGDEDVFDGGFMFSIFSHLKNPNRLLDIAEKHIRKFVAFEGHPGGKWNDYSQFLNSRIFKNITELGTLATSVNDPSPSRILWLCER